MNFGAFFSLYTKRKLFNAKRFPLWKKEDIETQSTINKMFEKASVLLFDSPSVSLEEFVVEDDDNVETAVIWSLFKAEKHHNSCSHIIQNEEHHEKYAQLFRCTFQW
ncbi:hypothetical protein TNCV_1322951 [Trichonephila clavipes]|nr:hypothetical protein TNCV_1322951 [Trichonephila clavipes]